MRKKNRILIVDDSRLNRAAVAGIFKQDYEVLEAENGKVALEILKKNAESIAVIILDLVMPVMDGFRFMDEFRKVDIYKYIPIIVSTTNDDIESERRCLELGVWDFIPKKFHPDIIRFRVLNAINKSKIDVLKYDFLTGILQPAEVPSADQEMLDDDKEQKYAFIHFDIDRFKMINTFYGVREGDKLICRVARALETVMGAYGKGTYGRINADIFGICMPYETEEDVLSVLREIENRIKNYATHYYLETSAGIYLIEDNDLEVSVIYDKASIAARLCKGQYMVRGAFYTKEMGENLVREQKIINEMDLALAEEQFVVYFQPKYELKHYRPYGAEALVRWKKPDGTLVSPGCSFQSSRKTDLSPSLIFMCGKRCVSSFAGNWMKEESLAPISVNVSRVNLYTPQFLENVVNLVKEYKISPKYLNLELTESVFSRDSGLINDAVDTLHKAGFTIMMDDFGSGYSSLNILKDVHLDILKMDMKFLSMGEGDVRGEKILEAVIKMAESLDMPVIAEGVEEKYQVEFLNSLGCNYIQGYYFAKPMPEEEYRRLIAENAEEK